MLSKLVNAEIELRVQGEAKVCSGVPAVVIHHALHPASTGVAFAPRQTIAALERYVQGLSSAVKKVSTLHTTRADLLPSCSHTRVTPPPVALQVRESGASDVLAVHERLDRLEDTVVKRMSADARNRETQLATVAKVGAPVHSCVCLYVLSTKPHPHAHISWHPAELPRASTGAACSMARV